MSETSLPLPKWLLGQELERARLDSGHELADAASALHITEISVRRFESGKTLINPLQLEILCGLYGVGADVRERLENLRELAAQPAWWTSLGPRPPAMAAMLRMEMSAVRIRTFDHSAIPGLLQTPAYARAVIRAVELDITAKKLEASVKLRMTRQTQVWDKDEPPEAIFIIDESALNRIPGPAETHRAQLARLLNPPANAVVQILPFRAGPSPATGTFYIFDFESDVMPKGVYAEGSVQAKDLTEAGENIGAYEQVWERARSMALPPAESAAFLHQMMEGIPDE